MHHYQSLEYDLILSGPVNEAVPIIQAKKLGNQEDPLIVQGQRLDSWFIPFDLGEEQGWQSKADTERSTQPKTCPVGQGENAASVSEG